MSALELPSREKVSVQSLCARISRMSGRPIHLLPLKLPLGSPDGLWLSLDDADYIVYEQLLAPVHQHQVILHEIGHLLCGHRSAPVMTEDVSQLLLPSLDPDLVRRVLGREHSQSEAEIEAELVGSLIGRRIGTWNVEQVFTVPPEAQAIAARLSALERPDRGRNE
ncbi:ParH-like protein [Streptomyces sp. NPDC053048]|uniref:ParH-like protein n=1 Tax=Streptomyces sp. NPDC053048 TaxID=3365694 RepID=UPI0037D5B4E4